MEAARDYIYQTERIGVRGLSRDELQGNYPKWFNDMEVCKHNSHGVFPKSMAELAGFIDSLGSDKSKIVWAVFELEGGQHVGNVSLQAMNLINRNAEFAVLMGDRNYWGKGYASEAAELLLLHGFQKLNLHRVYCGTAATNIGMQHLAERMRMVREGVRRQALFLNGEYTDIWEYGVLRDEFLANR